MTDGQGNLTVGNLTAGKLTAGDLTAQDGRTALRDHVAEKAASAREASGGDVDFPTIMRLLDDRAVVRYPVRLRFDAEPLEPGEFAHAAPRGGTPADGFDLYIHPSFAEREDVLPLLIAYHLVSVNYGDIASHIEAELFGATLLGMDVDTYYNALCRLADGMPTEAGT